jgi:hypothetical protein
MVGYQIMQASLALTDQIYNYGVNTGGGNNNVVPGDYYYKDWNE